MRSKSIGRFSLIRRGEINHGIGEAVIVKHPSKGRIAGYYLKIYNENRKLVKSCSFSGVDNHS